MKRILVLGAGRSSASLIRYLLSKAAKYSWRITVADASIALAQEKINGHPQGEAKAFNVNDLTQRRDLISQHDLVISLMPPPLHFPVAETCLEFSKHMLTASYVSPEIAALDTEAKRKNVLILMETGLDPGIDHMSAIKEIGIIHAKGGKLTSFRSYTGGLIAPESDNNPWHYKITWNPRNVVLAGKGASKYLENDVFREVDYKDLFTTIEKINVPGFGNFEGYPNRDSLKYMETYNLKGLSTFIRGTLRRPGYCSAWNIFVNAGFTNDAEVVADSPRLTYRNIAERILKNVPGSAIEEKLLRFGSKEDVEKIKWMGWLDETSCGMERATAADVLQKLMEEKWKLLPDDKDMIVMQHQFEYHLNKEKRKLVSSLVVKGEDTQETAMAKTVGLPLGIAAKQILEGKIQARGVQIPVLPEIYLPVLEELEVMGISFENEEKKE